MTAQAPTTNKELLQQIADDINAGKYKKLSACVAAVDAKRNELVAQNDEGFIACLPVAFIIDNDIDASINELNQQLGAWVDMGTLWAATPANSLIH